MLPEPTERLRFREMEVSDLDLMAGLLGDPDVMRHYPRPRTRDEARAWIDWNRRNYCEHGYGLWIIETYAGEFVGDCGLTWQDVEGTHRLEVGYHVVTARQRLGYATEAARACLALALGPIGESDVVAIIVATNQASRRVAGKLGMSLEREAVVHDRTALVYAVGRGEEPA